MHRLRSDEVWHHYAGAALTLHVIHPEGRYEAIRLGTAIDSRERPQALAPAGAWFGATVDAPDTWALVGCTVAPGFEFRDFERAERARLLRMFPPYREIIERLTKP
jgi:predicted cupin superfamily sugar epimerase